MVRSRTRRDDGWSTTADQLSEGIVRVVLILAILSVLGPLYLASVSGVLEVFSGTPFEVFGPGLFALLIGVGIAVLRWYSHTRNQ